MTHNRIDKLVAVFTFGLLLVALGLAGESDRQDYERMRGDNVITYFERENKIVKRPARNVPLPTVERDSVFKEMMENLVKNGEKK